MLWEKLFVWFVIDVVLIVLVDELYMIVNGSVCCCGLVLCVILVSVFSMLIWYVVCVLFFIRMSVSCMIDLLFVLYYVECFGGCVLGDEVVVVCVVVELDGFVCFVVGLCGVVVVLVGFVVGFGVVVFGGVVFGVVGCMFGCVIVRFVS